MPPRAILLPLFLEVILTFALLFWLAYLRMRDFSTGVTRPENIALREPNWSQRSLQVRLRGLFFIVSAITLEIMWVIYIVEISPVHGQR